MAWAASAITAPSSARRHASLPGGLGGALGALAGGLVRGRGGAPSWPARRRWWAARRRPASVLAEARAPGAARRSPARAARARCPAGVGLAWFTWAALAVAGRARSRGQGSSLARAPRPAPCSGWWRRWACCPVTWRRHRRDPLGRRPGGRRARFRREPSGAERGAALVQRAAAAHARTRRRPGRPTVSAAARAAGGGRRPHPAGDRPGRPLPRAAAGAAHGGPGRAGRAGAPRWPRRPAPPPTRPRATTSPGPPAPPPSCRNGCAALRAAHDRLRARLSLQVTILESTALALSTRRASSSPRPPPPWARWPSGCGRRADLEAQSLALAEPWTYRRDARDAETRQGVGRPNRQVPRERSGISSDLVPRRSGDSQAPALARLSASAPWRFLCLCLSPP